MEQLLDAKNMHYRQLNDQLLRMAKADPTGSITIKNVSGQRYIGAGLSQPITLYIEGTPGNHLGAYMNGATVIVKGNAQDVLADTMTKGRIVIHGSAGDAIGYAMRGGEIFIRDHIGYRAGVLMKQNEKQTPVIVAGGRVGCFSGEYMAGGNLILLGLHKPFAPNDPLIDEYMGTGMCGGAIYIRCDSNNATEYRNHIATYPDASQMHMVTKYVYQYAEYFQMDPLLLLSARFIRITGKKNHSKTSMYAY